MRKHTALLLGAVLAAACIALLLPIPQATAQSGAGNPLVSGNVVRDYARITFYWPERIEMSAVADGNRLLVHFDRQVNPDFGEILSKLYPYVQKADLATNRRTIVFTMQQPYRIRSFITDSESGVDILGIDQTTSPAMATPSAQSTVIAAAPPSPPVPRAKPQLPSTESPSTPQETTTAPAAPATTTETTAAPEAVTPETVAAAENPPVQESTTPAASAPESPLSASSPPPQMVQAAPVEAVTAAPIPDAATPQPITMASAARQQDFGEIQGESMPVELFHINKEAHIRFPFTERVAAAVWQRGRTIMVLFDKPVTLTGLDSIARQGRAWLAQIEQLGGQDFTLLRMDLVADLYIQSFKDREGYGWQLRVSPNRMYPAETITPQTFTGTNGKAVFLPTTQIGKIYHLRDPQVGDALDIVTLYASDRGLFPPRQFVDFALLTTQQGMAIAPKNDAVLVTQEPNGVRISMAGGLFISDNLDKAMAQAAGFYDERDELFKPSLFPAREWEVDSPEEFYTREAYLLDRIVTSPAGLPRNTARLELAQLYFAEELYNETLGVLNTIRRDDLDFFRANKLAALEGAAYLLNYRMPEAALSLSSDTLDGVEEGELLRKAVAAALDSQAAPVPYMQYNSNYIRQYPQALRQRLAIIAANHAVQQGDFRTPSDIFKSLDEDRISGEVADYIDYLKAKVAAASGRASEAERIWQRLADKVEDRQFRARSEYSLILLGLEEGTLSPDEAIKRLEALRIVWRGDDLERSLLSVLGQLQANQGNYWEGMKAWEELLENYPNTPDAFSAYQRLAETFRMLFMEDGADNMDQVKALALYNEFQELTPLGEDGNVLIQKMVDRLVNVDLLEEAASRLETQLQFRLAGEAKSRAGARLAVIHLLNREPEKALQALQESRIDGVPASLSLERNRIAAQALMDLKRPDQALQMIDGDYSPEGESVRLEIYWQKEDWPYVIDIIELMLRKRTDLAAKMSPQEGQRLLQLALAYVFLGEFEQLRYLREAYGPLMEGNPYADEFLFLTQEQITTSGDNFGKVVEGIGAIGSFMDSYRKQVQSGGLSGAVGNTANDDASDVAPANPQ